MNTDSKIKVYNEPYKHLIIEKLLKDEDFNNINKYFPSIDKLNKKNGFHTYALQKDRYCLYLDKKEDFDKLDNKNFWLNFYKSLYKQDFIQIFEENLKIKLNDYHIQTQLIIDRENYILPPHCDHGNKKKIPISAQITKFLTILIYIVENPNLDLGTEIYIPNKYGTIKLKHRSFDLFKKAPYRSNIGFSFVPVPNLTWHGVSKIHPNITRKTIQIFFKPKKNIDYETII